MGFIILLFILLFYYCSNEGEINYLGVLTPNTFLYYKVPLRIYLLGLSNYCFVNTGFNKCLKRAINVRIVCDMFDVGFARNALMNLLSSYNIEFIRLF